MCGDLLCASAAKTYTYHNSSVVGFTIKWSQWSSPFFTLICFCKQTNKLWGWHPKFQVLVFLLLSKRNRKERQGGGISSLIFTFPQTRVQPSVQNSVQGRTCQHIPRDGDTRSPREPARRVSSFFVVRKSAGTSITSKKIWIRSQFVTITSECTV